EVIFLITERDAWTINGYLGIVIIAVMALVAVFSLIYEEWLMSVIFFISAIIFGSGFLVIIPNESMIVMFCGNYSVNYRQGDIDVYELFSKRIRNTIQEQIYKSDVMHVHDVKGVPVSISIVILFKVVKAHKVVYDVEYKKKYIAIQSEMPVKNLMATY